MCSIFKMSIEVVVDKDVVVLKSLGVFYSHNNNYEHAAGQ